MNRDHDNYVENSYSTHTFLWPFSFGKEYCAAVKGPLSSIWKQDNALLEGSDAEFMGEYMTAQYTNSETRKIFMGDGETDAPCLRFMYNDELVSGMKYRIERRKDTSVGETQNRRYELKIHSIRLFLFTPFGVGVLAIDAYNTQQLSLDDVKRINDLGRWLRLPFLPDRDGYIMCAENLGIVIDGDERWMADFRAAIGTVRQKKPEQFFEPAEFIYGLLFGKIGAGTGTVTAGEKRMIDPASDARMYLVSLIKDDTLSEMAQNIHALLADDGETYRKERDLLYSIIFVDSDYPSCVDAPMQRSLLKKAVYYRWSGYGTIYTVTDLSLMCLTPKGISANAVYRLFLSSYVYMAVLVLTQRVSIEKFAKEASDAVEGAASEGELGENQIKRIINLHEKYVTWQNQINLFELTEKEQGRDVYALMRERMGVNGRLESLAQQLGNMYAIADVDQNKRTNAIVMRWASIAIFVDILLNLATFVLELTESGKQIFTDISLGIPRVFNEGFFAGWAGAFHLVCLLAYTAIILILVYGYKKKY